MYLETEAVGDLDFEFDRCVARQIIEAAFRRYETLFETTNCHQRWYYLYMKTID